MPHPRRSNTLRPLPPPGPPPRPRRALEASSSKYAWELTRTGNTVPLEHSLSQRTSFGAKQKKKATSVFSSPARHLPPPGAPPSTANQCAPSPILFPPEQLHRRPGTQAHPPPPTTLPPVSVVNGYCVVTPGTLQRHACSPQNPDQEERPVNGLQCAQL